MTDIFLMTADKDVSKLVRDSLEDSPVRITKECSTVKAAIDAYRDDQVPLIVLDYFLPETTGLDAIKTLKKMNEKLLFVLLTRVKTQSLLERAFRHGAHDTLVYPCSKDVLRDTILHRIAVLPFADAEES